MSSLNSRAGWKYGNVGSGTSATEMSRGNIKGLHMHTELGKRGGQEVFIDVESHEMIDVLESDKMPSPSDSSTLKMYPLEKEGRMSVGQAPSRPSVAQ
ncbi:uncharacterized protein FIBRA_03591 [Fibroporia radiculosa]|uniref:Uncharacterized protein n=1 Tax=Fibroporia radiculosa TaxID=599839 RepID=J4GNK2_9APHY|nr:uncharacterized protein FIBRA_03591 [Fibroporia radiculosa]CCM01535.1 predicted protein [Fibroporia radiculosa]